MRDMTRRQLLGYASIGVASAFVWPGEASGRASGQPAITVVEGGDVVATVQWSASETGGPVEFAASELADYMHRLTGVRPGVQRVRGWGEAVALVSGTTNTNSEPDTQMATSIQRELAGKPPDSYVLRAAPGVVVAAGVGERGALYAVYELLVLVGIRFFAPTFAFYEGNAERVPEATRLIVPTVHVTRSPDFALRRKYIEEGQSHNRDNLLPLIDWMGKHRLNVLVYPYDYYGAGVTRYDEWRSIIVPELTKRGIQVEVGGHGYESFLPPREYPRFYTEGTDVFDVHNDAALRQYVDNVLAYLERHPEITIFDAWPPDSASWPKPALERWGSPANLESHVVNTLARAVAERLPGVRIERVAYLDTLRPPDKGHEFDSDVIVDFAPIDRTYANPLADPNSEDNATQYAVLREWCEKFDGDVAMYEYLRRYRWRSMPSHPTRILIEDMATYRRLGLAGTGLYSEPADWIPFELVHLLSADAAWDGGVSEGYVDSYLRDRFGDAAAPMARYFAQTTGDPDRLDEDGFPTTLREKYAEASRALAEARTEARGGSAMVIERLTWNIEVAAADVDISFHEQRGDDAALVRAKQRYRDLVKLHRFDGVVLEATYVPERYDEALDPRDVARRYRAPAWGSLGNTRLRMSAGTKGQVMVRGQDVDYAGHQLDWSAEPVGPVRLSTASGGLRVDGPGREEERIVVTVDAGAAGGEHRIPFRFSVEGGLVTSVDLVIEIPE